MNYKVIVFICLMLSALSKVHADTELIVLDDDPFVRGIVAFEYSLSGSPLILYIKRTSDDPLDKGSLFLATCHKPTCDAEPIRAEIAPIKSFQKTGLDISEPEDVVILKENTSSLTLLAKQVTYDSSNKKHEDLLILRCDGLECRKTEMVSTAILKERKSPLISSAEVNLQRSKNRFKPSQVQYSVINSEIHYHYSGRNFYVLNTCSLYNSCRDIESRRFLPSEAYPLGMVNYQFGQWIAKDYDDTHTLLVRCSDIRCDKYKTERFKLEVNRRISSQTLHGRQVTWFGLESAQFALLDCTGLCTWSDLKIAAINDAYIVQGALTNTFSVFIFEENVTTPGIHHYGNSQKFIMTCDDPICSSEIRRRSAEGIYTVDKRNSVLLASPEGQGIGLAFGGEDAGVYYKYCTKPACVLE